jgi:hypothetical protein
LSRVANNKATQWRIIRKLFKGITGFTAVVNSCLQNIFLNFIQNFSKSLIVNYMIKLDKSNDHNDFLFLLSSSKVYFLSQTFGKLAWYSRIVRN